MGGAGVGRPVRVGCYHGDHPLAPRDWQAALDSHDVIVATGQMFLNALAAGRDRLAAVRLLVGTHLMRTPVGCVLRALGIRA